MRQFAIGDIHGCVTSLQVLDHELTFNADDAVITLGDYRDRGPDSSGVTGFLIGLRKRCRLVAFRGNRVMVTGNSRNQHAECPVRVRASVKSVERASGKSSFTPTYRSDRRAYLFREPTGQGVVIRP